MEINKMALNPRTNQMAFTVALVILCCCTDYTVSGPISNSSDTQVSPAQPPLVFPNDNLKYKILPNNKTISHTLSHNNEDELYDLSHFTKPAEQDDPDYMSVIPLNTPKSVGEINPKLQSEMIDSQDIPVLVYHDEHKISMLSHWSVIIISTLLTFVVVAILGIYAWKKLSTRKYGSRQILINEEDPPINSQF